MSEEDDELTPVCGVARGLSVEQVAHALRTGMSPGDRAFDRFLPCRWRFASNLHWTPLAVVQKVAGWLDEIGLETVVDIGSGAGKFCVAAAIACRCSFQGVEQRARLVDASRELARRFDVADRVTFLEGIVGRCSLPDADAYYLYNPFGENLFGSRGHLGDDVELSDDRYERDIAFMEGFLERAKVGTYIIKYNGFGGRVPPAYELVRADRTLSNALRMWRKAR